MEVIDIADVELQLEELVDEVEQGKNFVISQDGVALARLIPTQKASVRKPGSLKGKIHFNESDDNSHLENFRDYM
ncbi:MAG TPA: hypothetical protein DIW64_20635 [Cellvibrio sp.]|nr:hypothetical protein [Cellvibrio sp.]